MWTGGTIYGVITSIPQKRPICTSLVTLKSLGYSNGSGIQAAITNTNFFFWLLLKNRLSTRNILRHKTMVLDSYECEMCSSGVEETLEHLFVRCPFATACWSLINIHASLQASVFEAIDSFKAHLN